MRSLLFLFSILLVFSACKTSEKNQESPAPDSSTDKIETATSTASTAEIKDDPCVRQRTPIDVGNTKSVNMSFPVYENIKQLDQLTFSSRLDAPELSIKAFNYQQQALSYPVWSINISEDSDMLVSAGSEKCAFYADPEGHNAQKKSIAITGLNYAETGQKPRSEVEKIVAQCLEQHAGFKKYSASQIQKSKRQAKKLNLTVEVTLNKALEGSKAGQIVALKTDQLSTDFLNYLPVGIAKIQEQHYLVYPTYQGSCENYPSPLAQFSVN